MTQKILLAGCVGVAAMCATQMFGGVARASDEPPKIRYEVTGSSPNAEYISYQTAGGQQRAVQVRLPWSAEFTGFPGEVFVLSAQGQGTIACRILIDGTSVFDASSSGAPGRAVCSH